MTEIDDNISDQNIQKVDFRLEPVKQSLAKKHKFWNIKFRQPRMIHIVGFKVLICAETTSGVFFLQIQDGRHSIGAWDKSAFGPTNQVFTPFEPLTPHQLYEIQV